jgi:hypothetical protein
VLQAFELVLSSSWDISIYLVVVYDEIVYDCVMLDS